MQYGIGFASLIAAFLLYASLPVNSWSLGTLVDFQQNAPLKLCFWGAGLLAAYNLVRAPTNNSRVKRHYMVESLGTNRLVQPAIEGPNNWVLQCPRPECNKKTRLQQYDCHQAFYRCEGCGWEVAVRRKNFRMQLPPQHQPKPHGATVWRSIRDMQTSLASADELVTISGPLSSEPSSTPPRLSFQRERATDSQQTTTAVSKQEIWHRPSGPTLIEWLSFFPDACHRCGNRRIKSTQAT